FQNVRYTDSEVKVGQKYQYVLTAFFDDSSEASDTVEITITGKGVAREPSAFRVEGTVKNDDNTVNAKASWGLPYFEEPMAYGYCSYPAGGNSLSGTSQMSCIIGWNESDMYKFDDDLYLVGVEFAMACTNRDLKAMSTIVFVDDKKVYDEPYDLEGGRFSEREWKRVWFNKVFKMKQKQEIAVGYSVTYDPEKITSGVFANDEGPGVTGKSDLVSFDGVEFGSLKLMFGVSVNLCINALVVRQRDLAEAAFASDPQEYLGHKVMRMDLKGELGKEQKFTNAPKITSEGIRLLGFNIYRDGEKLNKNNLLTDFSYEENVPRGEYEYVVGAVYEAAEEQKDTIFADFTTVGIEDLKQAYGVSVYPNPTSDVLNITGDYASFMLVDMNGRVLMRDVRNTESVSLAGLNNGVYFVLITLPNGDKRAVKVIKR
ncbi:MAG: T9SS type A sorting domain-containing protein, partial [Bacteroidales bacterium]|nr:T9SS type A sorting domain-containing protein [Bacteroidales bacterium]